MKQWISLLLCLLMLGSMVVCAAASETEGDNSQQSEPTVCTHSWGEATGPDATCTTEGTKTSVCTMCADTKTETIPAPGHSFGSWVSVDTVEHKRVCSVCGAEEMGNHNQSSENILQQATCTAEGKKEILCLCGYKLLENVVIPMTDHAYSDWTVDSASHSRTCSVCEGVDSGSHQWGEPKVTKEATCKEDGEQVFTCTACAKTKLEVVAKKKTHTYDNACDPVCNVCEAERDAGHKFSTIWSKNASGHWHECSVCKEKKDEDEHFPGPAATEQKAQTCLTCNYELMPKKKHVHEHETQWSSDVRSHWHACTGCDEQKDYALHTFDSVCDTECNVCGHKNDDAHEFGDSWESDEKKHWSICSLCGEEREPEKHIPGPEASEETPQLCTVCGYLLAAAQEHTHEFGYKWQYDSETHWQECECGEVSIAREHSWDEGKEQKGNKIRFTCEECGLERTEVQKSSGGFWWIVLVILILLLGGAVTALILIMRTPKQEGKFSKK